MFAASRWSIAAVMVAAASLAGPPAIAASGDPVAFVKTLYALPELWTSIVPTPDGRSQYLTPALARLFVDGNGNYKDYRGYLDYDPLADSRPFQLSDETFTVVEHYGTWVKVELKNYGRPETLMLLLDNSGDHWRLVNIDYPDGRTLLKDLQGHC